MADGFVLGGGEGEKISPVMSLKVGAKQSGCFSVFEVVDIGPGFDVGAHLHHQAEEMFTSWRVNSTFWPLSRGPERLLIGSTGSPTAAPKWPGVARGALCSSLGAAPTASPTLAPAQPACSSWFRRPVTSIIRKHLQNLSPRRPARGTTRSENCVP
jgi:hypothetical protein